MAIIHETLPVGMLGCNCSIIGDEISREAIVIDPGDDVSEIIGILERNQLSVTMIVITHARALLAGADAHRTAVAYADLRDPESILGQPDVRSVIEVEATAPGGKRTVFTVAVRIDTPDELEYYRHGGILQYVLRQLAT